MQTEQHSIGNIGADSRELALETGFRNNKRWRWINLIYLIFAILPLVFEREVSAIQWAATAAALALFLPLYWKSYDWEGGRLLLLILGMAALGYALTPLNPGGNTFLIYALITAGWAMPTRRALITGAILLLLYAALVFLLQMHIAFVLFVTIFGSIMMFTGVTGRLEYQRNAELRLSQDEIKRLARMNERERFARDLHDLLGHTLSVIAIKSELAGKLLDRDPHAAKNQIQEVEQVARKALSEVREAVSGFRASGLAAEIANARLSLYSANVSMDVHASALPALPSDVENALALCLREAVTNVLRHAHAQRMELEIQHSEQSVSVRVSDDGRGADIKAGNGLQGLQERVQALGGKLRIDSAIGSGTRIDIFIPLRSVA